MQFRSTGKPMHDALLVASDPSVVAASPSTAAAAGMGVTAYLAATPVDPDLSTWADLDAMDAEIDGWGILLTEDEHRFKQEAWLEIHKDYLAEQEEKKAMAQAAAEAGGVQLGEDGKPIPRRQYKKKVKNGPAGSPAEAAMRLLAEKKYSDKINYSALQGLLTKLEPKDKGKGDGKKDKDDDDDDDEDDDEDEEDDDDDADDGEAGAEDDEDAAVDTKVALGAKRRGVNLASQMPSMKQQRVSHDDDGDDVGGGADDDEPLDDDDGDMGGGGDDDDY